LRQARATLRRDPRATGRAPGTLGVPGAGHFLQVEGRVPLSALDAVAAFID
jgi:hypothetical protein